MAQARDGAVGKGSFELAWSHLCYAFWGKIHDDIGGVEIGNDSSLGMCIMRAAQLALITPHNPITNRFIDPVRQFLVMVLNEQA